MDRSRFDRLQARDPLERRRLAGAIRADEADELRFGHMQLDPLDGLDAAVRDAQIFEL